MSPAPKMAKAPAAGESTDRPAGSVGTVTESATPAREEIAQLAYSYWVARGQPYGSPEEDWLRAEQDLLLERLVWGQHRRLPSG
jgi:Protein of unknown function (DUF2934)